MTQSPKKPRNAFTLIEVLVVVSLLIVLTALLIPRLRIINNERQIREASRKVASMFSRASQAAIYDEVSGVMIERNPNVVSPWPGLTDGNGNAVNFAHSGNRMFFTATSAGLSRRQCRCDSRHWHNRWEPQPILPRGTDLAKRILTI